MGGVNWFTPLYLLAIYGLVRYFWPVKNTTKPDAESVNWRPIESLGITLFIYFGSQLVGGLLAYGVAVLGGYRGDRALDWLSNDSLGGFVAIALVESVTVLVLYSFLRRRGATLRTIGLVKQIHWRDLGYAVLGFFIYFGLLLFATYYLKKLIPALDTDQKQEIGFTDPVRSQLPLVFVSLVILPPIVEELLIRGFLYSGLRNGLSRVWVYVLASGLFGIAHLQAGNGEPLLWIAGIDTFILSLVLIYLREKTNALWAPIMLHMMKNGMAFLFLFVFKQ